MTKTLLSVLSLGLALSFSAQPVYADRDKEHKHEYKSEHKKDKSYKGDHDYDKKRYSDRHDYDDNHRYAERSNLPPGLQKRYEKTGKGLPPGWQKKMHRGEVMDRDIYDHGRVIGPIDAQGRVTIDVDGKLFRLYKNTREIIDILN